MSRSYLGAMTGVEGEDMIEHMTMFFLGDLLRQEPQACLEMEQYFNDNLGPFVAHVYAETKMGPQEKHCYMLAVPHEVHKAYLQFHRRFDVGDFRGHFNPHMARKGLFRPIPSEVLFSRWRVMP